MPIKGEGLLLIQRLPWQTKEDAWARVLPFATFAPLARLALHGASVQGPLWFEEKADPHTSLAADGALLTPPAFGMGGLRPFF